MTSNKGEEKYRLDSGKLYLDNASTSLKCPIIIQKLHEYGVRFQLNPMLNSSSLMEERHALDNVRLALLKYFNLNTDDYQVIFTSGSTEGLNMVLQSLFLNNNKPVVISSSLEHKAVLDTLNFLESVGAEISLLEHDVNGTISMESLREEINQDVCFVSIMHVNNETGNVNDVEEISAICKDYLVPFICDTTQSVGKIEFNGELFDAFVGSAHKFGGPFGVGFLISKKGLITNPIQHGGKQEFGLRPGTHNLPGILTMMDALNEDFNLDKDFVKSVFQDLDLDLKARIGQNGCDYIYAFKVDDIVAFEESNSGYIFGRGSACNSGLLKSSHVYSALGYDENVVRISF